MVSCLLNADIIKSLRRGFSLSVPHPASSFQEQIFIHREIKQTRCSCYDLPAFIQALLDSSALLNAKKMVKVW